MQQRSSAAFKFYGVIFTKRTVPSAHPAASVLSSGENARAKTTHGIFSFAFGLFSYSRLISPHVISGNSMSRIFLREAGSISLMLSRPPSASNLPSLENAAELYSLSVCAIQSAVFQIIVAFDVDK